MQSPALPTDPSTLPLRDIHLPEGVGWWPPAPGWWLLPVLLLLGLVALWYSRLLYRRRRYSAVNMAKQELAGIRSRYDTDRDAVHCARAISSLLRRVSISLFPRVESAGLTGKEWLEVLQVEGHAGGNTSQLLLEAPYRHQVAEAEVDALYGFCSDWLEQLTRSKP